MASESDLTQSLNLPQVNGRENGAVVGDVEPISITVNATFAKQQQQQLETEGSDSGSNKLVIDTSRDNSVVSGGIGIGAVDEVDNVAVKKSEPLLITTQPINDKACFWQSRFLLNFTILAALKSSGCSKVAMRKIFTKSLPNSMRTTNEPFKNQQEADAMSEGPDKSCSTSFESTTDDSVLLDTMAATPTSPTSPSNPSSDNNVLDGSVITLDSSKVRE